MALEHYERSWLKRLFAAGDAMKWLLLGSFALAAANLAAPIVASIIDALHQAAPGKDYVFVLIGGFTGAAMGAIWGNKRSGPLTALLSLFVAAGFYVAEGGPTQAQCQRVPQGMQQLTSEQYRILRTWVTCLKDNTADICSELPMSGKKLDELRSRKDRLWAMWRDDC
jgi:hypothetical protein